MFWHRKKLMREDVEMQRIINNTPRWVDAKVDEIMRDIDFLEQAGWDIESFYNRGA